MKKEKGFTLVELLAVITLLSAIVLVSVPTIINTLRKNEDKTSEEFENALKRSAEVYVERNREMFPELDEVGGSVSVEASTLVNEGYLKQDLEKLNDKKSIDNYSIKVTVNNDETFNYELENK